MARRRFNKKVALIGSVVFALAVMAALGLFFYLGRDPAKFIQDGDSALQVAKATGEASVQQDNYKQAERHYMKALGLMRTDEAKVGLLFKFADVYMGLGQWRDVLGVWNQIIRLDNGNVRARLGRLQYTYIIADSGMVQGWREVVSQGTDFLTALDKKGTTAEVLADDLAKYEIPGIRGKNAPKERLGPYLYIATGRANLELSRLGMVTNREETLGEARKDLEKARELEPDNVEVYRYLAEAALAEGNIRAEGGVLEGRRESAQQALELLAKAVEVSPGNVESHINLLRLKLGVTEMADANQQRAQVLALGPEFQSLVQKFSGSAEVFAVLADYYSDFRLGREYMDKAIEAIERAMALDKESVGYAISAASLYYRKYSIGGQTADMERATTIAKNALLLPDAQDTTGPRVAVSRSNRIRLNGFLANCYIEQILESPQEQLDRQGEQWLAEAEQTVRQIEQMLGSGEDPHVVKWQGMLELARSRLGKGDTSTAVAKMYSAYEQLRASDRADARLSYQLAKQFKNTPEVGAIMEFIISALRGRIEISQPEARLDHAEVLMRVGEWRIALASIDIYEGAMGPNERSRVLRATALVGDGQMDAAAEQLGKMRAEDPNTIRLKGLLAQAKISQVRRLAMQKQLQDASDVLGRTSSTAEQADVNAAAVEVIRGHARDLVKCADQLMSVEPNFVDNAFLVSVCDDLILTKDIEQAKTLLRNFLGKFPEHTNGLFYERLLSEPDPAKVSDQRRKEIQRDVIAGVSDPAARAAGLGVYYYNEGDMAKAGDEFQKVLDVTAEQTKEGTALDARYRAVEYLFDISLQGQDWKRAEQVAKIAQQENLDECSGRFFDARLAAAKGDDATALMYMDEALKQKPVFAHGLLLRYRINTMLGNEHAAMQDVLAAARMNPLDRLIAKELAQALYRRNQRLGANVTGAQEVELKSVVERAVRLNPDDVEILSFYAEFIGENEPDKAIALRQTLQRNSPSIQNALLLGRMAMRMGRQESRRERKEALLNMAGTALEQAKNYEPQNSAVLESCAEYYRLTGQEDRAEQLLSGSADWRLLWRHHVRAGEFDSAKAVLEKEYQARPKDANVLKGLMFIAEKTMDKESAKKCYAELVAVEDTAENYLLALQAFLNVGLVDEAQKELESFNEKYPGETRRLLLGAWVAMRQGRMKDAMEQANRYLETEQGSAIAWRLRGEINHMMAKYEQAITDLKRSISLADDPVSRVSLARAYLRTGRSEDAITELKAAIDDAQAPAQARVLLEQVYTRLGRREVLKSFYDETLTKQPESVLWHNHAAGFAASIDDLAAAERLYGQSWRKSNEQGKPDRDALAGYLGVLLAAGKLDKLFEEAGKYVNTDFATIAYFRMAEGRMKMGDKQGAIGYCRIAVDKAGTDEAAAANVLERSYVLLGAEAVRQICEEMLKADPESLSANWAMFNLARVEGEYNKAIAYIDKCSLKVGADNAAQIQYTMQKADVLMQAYKKTSDNSYLGSAIGAYESLLAKMPNNTNVLNNLAYILAENEQGLDKALEYAKAACQTRPNDPGLVDTYAFVLYKNGKYEEAAERIGAALQLYEAERIGIPADVHEHAGQIYEKLGDKVKALDAYKQALEAGGQNMPQAARDRITSAVNRVSR